MGRNIGNSIFGSGGLAWLSLSLLLFSLSPRALAQSQQQPPSASGVPSAQAEPPQAPASSSQRSVGPLITGTITGTIVDTSGAAVVGAQVKLTREDQSPARAALTGNEGEFSFAEIPPGPFQLTISAAGFGNETSTGTLHAGEIYVVPQITMAVATAVTEVRVTPPRVEIAEAQIKEEEKQRVLGLFPNFYVSYSKNPVPLTARQKFELAWKTSMDPVSFGLIGAIAGIEQATDQFSGYGQGGEGYGKRYGAAYADFFTGTFIGAAILPSVLRQDPRYFYKGTGTRKSRFFYAVANAVICKGDNGHWQPNYSNILGSLASGGISNLYYPSTDRDGVTLTFENALIGIGATAAANVLQEFIIRKLTPSAANGDPANP
ncbi:MAG: carboxypeptidase-like regulatory domain-containing protein [Candidatus Acidiferrales bacterium]